MKGDSGSIKRQARIGVMGNWVRVGPGNVGVADKNKLVETKLFLSAAAGTGAFS